MRQSCCSCILARSAKALVIYLAKEILISLQGEKVLDLGSGAGMDVFLAASKVGPDGQAIGLDMSSVRVTFLNPNDQPSSYHAIGHD